MIIATIWKFGLVLPDLNLKAFSLEAVNYINVAGEAVETSFLNLTLGGYARILALMTGIEIFANLVAAYEGKRAERSKKAFGSLMIIMGTTALTMIIVGPAILALSEVSKTTAIDEVSVFTQTMNALLPSWASYVGTLIGIAVLLSACAAAAQGIQNLALGLRYRHYVSADMGQRNKHDVAGKPVWIMVAVIGVCFVLFGTHEETYLALYAAGVFILLSMTGWAACKRLMRDLKEKSSAGKMASLVGTAVASVLTSIATLIIFEERFFEGAWLYFVMVPALYVGFTYYRNKLGAPTSVEDRLGSIISEQRYLPIVLQETNPEDVQFKKIMVPLNGTSLAEQVLATARSFARSFDAQLELFAVDEKDKFDSEDQAEYLEMVSGLITADGLLADYKVKKGEPSTEIDKYAQDVGADLIIMTTRGKFSVGDMISDSIAQKVIKKTLTPVLLIRPTDNWQSRRSKFKRILVALDGSEASERVLPYVRTFAEQFDSKIVLVSVPEGSESEEYMEKIQQYLNDIAETMNEEGLHVKTLVAGSGPARTIVALSEEERVDLIMMASHGRGGISREGIHLGSVTDMVVQKTPCPMFILPLTRSQK
jgi:nucleotide-binding universal stress UspA family protein